MPSWSYGIQTAVENSRTTLEKSYNSRKLGFAAVNLLYT